LRKRKLESDLSGTQTDSFVPFSKMVLTISGDAELEVNSEKTLGITDIFG
jgi:hypothetical protein